MHVIIENHNYIVGVGNQLWKGYHISVFCFDYFLSWKHQKQIIGNKAFKKKFKPQANEHLRATGVRLLEEVWSAEREETGFGGQLTELTSLVCDIEYCILLLCATVSISVKWGLDFCGSPWLRLYDAFSARSGESIPGWGTKIPHAMQHSQKIETDKQN